MAKKQPTALASVFAKPAQSTPPPAGGAGQASAAPSDSAPADRGDGFDLDGEDEIQSEAGSGEEQNDHDQSAVVPTPPPAPAPSPSTTPKQAAPKPTKSARPAPAPALEDDEKPLTQEEREALSAVENARRLKQSQDAAVAQAEHIAHLSQIGRENVRRVQLRRLVSSNPHVRELVAENAKLKAELAALKKTSSPAG